MQHIPPVDRPVTRSVVAGLLFIVAGSGQFGLGLSGYGLAMADEDFPADTMAVVNGKAVLRGAHTAIVRQLQQNGQQVDSEQILDELINLELLTQKAEGQDLHNRGDIAALLRLQYVQTMAQAFMGVLSKDVDISDEALRREYEVQTAQMAVDEYLASHILLEDELSAREVVESLNNGADFATLAKSKSTGPTGPSGGDLGWFQTENMAPEFSAAVEKMSVGDFSSEPVKSDFGWHVIYLADKRSSQKPAFEAIQSDLRNFLLRRALSGQIDALRSEADITLVEQ